MWLVYEVQIWMWEIRAYHSVSHFNRRGLWTLFGTLRGGAKGSSHRTELECFPPTTATSRCGWESLMPQEKVTMNLVVCKNNNTFLYYSSPGCL